MAIQGIFRRKAKENRLKKIMEKGGFKTQKEFAEFLGISECLLSRKMNGLRNFSTKTALQVHERTSIPLKDLIQ